jgi:hypothetical protein
LITLLRRMSSELATADIVVPCRDAGGIDDPSGHATKCRWKQQTTTRRKTMVPVAQAAKEVEVNGVRLQR